MTYYIIIFGASIPDFMNIYLIYKTDAVIVKLQNILFKYHFKLKKNPY